jgi:UPF0755 protein
MPRFGRQDNQRSERTAEERERARLERAARRAAREGQAPPSIDDPAVSADPVEAPPPEPIAVPDPEPEEIVAWEAHPEPEPEAEPEFEPEPEIEPEPEPEPVDDGGETREFTPADEAEALGRRPPRQPEPEPEPEDHATRAFSSDEIASARGDSPPAADPDDLDIAWHDAAKRGEPLPDRPVRQIRPEPAAPPLAPAGSLPDTEPAPTARRQRRTRRSRRRGGGAVMTPPGDVPRGPRTRGRRGPARIAAIVAILVVIAVLLWLVNAFAQPFGDDGTGSVTVNIPEGASSGKIGDVLADAGVVDSGFIFSVRASLSGARGDLRSGRHVLHHDMSYGAAIDALSAKPTDAEAAPVINVTIPEGRTRREIAAIAEKAGLEGSYTDATAKAPADFSLRRYGAPADSTLEGFLFPATYELRDSASAATLRNRQLDAFRTNFATVNMTAARRRNLDAYDVLIIASMVEREARVAKERPIIAAVIQNRLRENMPLGIDATIRYATNNWSKPLSQSELRRDSPYNTRLHRGLPPTPIGNPGLASIEAAANPANRDYLFYVVKPGTCGEHAFSRSDAQFEKDVAAYNAARKANGGKSPTKC